MIRRRSSSALGGLVVLALIGLVIPAGCASTPPIDEDPTFATLEVVNLTPRDVVVWVRGRGEGTAVSGERMRVRYLPPGEAKLEARAERVPGAQRVVKTVELPANGVAVWEIRPEVGEALPAPPPLAHLLVKNKAVVPLVVFLGPRRLGRVFPEQTRQFDDLEAGTHALRAVSDDGRVKLDRTVTMAGGEVPTAAILTFEGATVTVANDTDEAVILYIDGVQRDRIDAGTTWTSSEETPGPHVARAVSVKTSRPYETLLDLGDAPARWALSSGQAEVEVVNKTGEALSVTLPGRPAVVVAADASATLEDVPSAPLRVVAIGAETGAGYAVDIELAPGQAYRWMPTALAGTLRVSNRTTRTLALYLDGRPRMELAPNKIALLSDLPAKPYVVEAIDLGDQARWTEQIDPATRGSATWIIRERAGAVEVTNDRDELVTVYVDAQRVGVVEARSAQAFGGVPTGPRLVEVQGAKSGAVLRFPVEVAEDATVGVRLEDPSGQVVVRNTTTEPLRPEGLLSRQRPRIAPGETVAFSVPVGVRPLQVSGIETGATFARAFTVTPGAELTWVVAPETATLEVWNQVDEALAIVVDGRSLGSVDPGQTGAWPGVPVGKRKLQAVGIESGRSWAVDRYVVASEPLKWTVQRQPARLAIDNRTGETLTITLEGRLFGTVQAGTRSVLTDIEPGHHVIVALGERSGVAHRFEATLLGGQDERLVINPPTGTLVVDNRSEQAVEVYVDKKQVATIQPGGAPTPVAVPAGPRAIEILWVRDRVMEAQTLIVEPDQAIALPVARRVARLVSVNRTDAPLTVFIGAHPLGVVEPGGSLVTEDLPAGDVELRARDAAGAIVYTESRRLLAGETATLVLAAPAPPAADTVPDPAP